MCSPGCSTPDRWPRPHFAISSARAVRRGASRARLARLQRHTGGVGSGRTPAALFKTVEQGAATSVLLAVSPLLEGVGGRYFTDCNETDTIDRRRTDLTGVARYALDPANAERLWTLSERLLAGTSRS